ncbi:MAG: 6-phosphogluconolactonase [Candidatus Saccharibacteria bacterium]
MNYIYTEKPIEQAADHIANTISEHLSNGERVLWLLTGGSGIRIAVIVSEALKKMDLSNLYISLTDERYGLVGHKDENWQQLIDAGFNPVGSNTYRPLIGQDIEKTTTEFNDWLSNQFSQANFKIGIFGIGADGHTAGIKPNSDSGKSSELAISFKCDDFERVTINFKAIRLIDEAVVQATGSNKRNILHELMYENIPINNQPAQILKTISKTTIYSNNKEEEIS